MDANTCLTCGNKFAGKFCNQCGEKVIDQNDRRFLHFISELINALTFADSKLWRSIATILKHPGKMSHDYVIGRRTRYMKPVSLFFLANLIYFFSPIFNTFHTPLQVQTGLSSSLHRSLAKRMVDKEVSQNWESYESYEEQYNLKTTELSKMLLIVFAVFLTILFLPIHLGTEKRLLADHLTLSLEMMTYVLVFCIQGVGILFLILGTIGLDFLRTEAYVSLAALVLLIYFVFASEWNFYGLKGWRRWMNTVLVLIAVMAVLTLYRILLFFVTFWMV